MGTWFLKLNYKAPYLSITTGNASTSIGISFQTPVYCKAEVYVGTDLTYSDFSSTETSLNSIHHFNFTGLTPNTVYHYTINTSTTGVVVDYFGRDFTFKTAPTENNPQFTVGIVGDTRPDIFGYGAQELLMVETIAHDPNFILNLGDIVMTSLRVDHWARFFQTISLNWYSATHPYMISVGNHETAEFGSDTGILYNDLFYFPHKNLYYAFNYSNTCFISLDVLCDSFLNPNPDGISQTQLDWLTTTLQEANASDKINWIVVSGHVPAFSSGGHEEVYIEKVWPILQEYEVDLCMWAHDHYYERLNVNGTPCVIIGGGGAESDPFVPHLSPYSELVRAGFQYSILEVDNLQLTLTSYDTNNIPFDVISLTQTNPWRV